MNPSLIAAIVCLGQGSTPSDAYAAYEAKISGLTSATGVAQVEMTAGNFQPYEFGIEKPGKFYVWSETQAFICNGKKVWQYMPKRKEYNEPPFEHYGSGPMLNGFAPFFRKESKPAPELKFEDYEGKSSLLAVQKPNDQITLTAVIDRATLLPKAWIQEVKGKRSLIKYENIQLNVPIQESKFALPAEAKPMSAPSFDSSLLPQGKDAPLFALDNPLGGKIDLAKELKGGKILWLNFWFYACGPCQEELPRLQQLYAKLKGQGLRVVTVNHGDAKDLIQSFLKEKSFSFPVAMNGKGGPDVAKLYGVQAYPTNYLISPDGKILARFTGYNEERVLAELKKVGLNP